MTGSMTKIENYLDELYPNPKCELKYTKDYELLLATMLSAQTTDKRVNEVTAILFKKYPTLEDLSKADINEVMSIIKPIGTFRKKAYNLIEIARKLIEEPTVEEQTIDEPISEEPIEEETIEEKTISIFK